MQVRKPFGSLGSIVMPQSFSKEASNLYPCFKFSKQPINKMALSGLIPYDARTVSEKFKEANIPHVICTQYGFPLKDGEIEIDNHILTGVAGTQAPIEWTINDPKDFYQNQAGIYVRAGKKLIRACTGSGNWSAQSKSIIEERYHNFTDVEFAGFLSTGATEDPSLEDYRAFEDNGWRYIYKDGERPNFDMDGRGLIYICRYIVNGNIIVDSAPVRRYRYGSSSGRAEGSAVKIACNVVRTWDEEQKTVWQISDPVIAQFATPKTK